MNRWLWGAMLLVAFVGWQLTDKDDSIVHQSSSNPMQREMIAKTQQTQAVSSLVQQEPLKLTVVLKEHYKDGVTESTRKEETIWSMVDFWAAYEGWTVASQAIDRVVFQRNVEDISPLTKRQGYFGLTPDGDLAVFQGLPGNGKLIESFKPIPVKPLESQRKIKLENGIKIESYKHFKEVVSQYSKPDEV